MGNTDLKKHILILNEYFDGKRDFAFNAIKASSSKRIMAYSGKEEKKPRTAKRGGTLAFTVDINDVESYISKSRAKYSFFDLVEMHMSKSGMSPSEVYRNAQISKQDFSRYVKPDVQSLSRNFVFSLAVGLRLDCADTKALLRSAGYGYNKRSKFDLIIMYCIENKLYDIELINMLLDEFRQKMLKSHYYKE